MVMLREVIFLFFFLTCMDQLHCAMFPIPFAPESIEWNNTNNLLEINFKLQKSLPFLRGHLRIFQKKKLYFQSNKEKTNIF